MAGRLLPATTLPETPMDVATNDADQRVRHFRQILMWPLQLMPLAEGGPFQNHSQLLDRTDADNPWRELADEFSGDPEQFHERHYSEFVTFLPYVQRFLYGEGGGQKGSKSRDGESPIRIFRRHDVAKVRMHYKDRDEPIDFDVAHLDLYFFYDIEVLILVVEIFADDLELRQVHDTLYRFGRAYPPSWDDDGSGSHCLKRSEWITPDGRVLAASDYEKRSKYLTAVSRFRAPCISSHWEFLLRPLVLHHSDEEGLVRYRQIEYHRMPLLAYLAMDDPRALSRDDFARLVLVTGPGKIGAPPASELPLDGFEARYCYDRYWHPHAEQPGSRQLSCGHAVIMVGSARDAYFSGLEDGLLGQFRHQFFLLALIPHFHKAALLMLSDRLVTALNHLEHRPGRIGQGIQAHHSADPRGLPALHPSLLVLRDFRPGTGPLHIQADQRTPRHRAPVHRIARGNPGHEPVPRQRQPAPAVQYGRPPDRGDHRRPDRDDHHRRPRHEPARRHARSLR
jgi:hypothetical protein